MTGSNPSRGFFGPQTGFPLPTGYSATTPFTVAISGGAPSGTLTVLTTLDEVNPNTGAISDTLASTSSDIVVTAASPTLTVGLPPTLTTGAAATPFSATLTNPTSGTVENNVRPDFAITGIAGLRADQIQLYYQVAPNNYQPVMLTQDMSGTITGFFGPPNGFQLTAPYSATTPFTVSISAAAPTGTLTVTTTLHLVDPNTGAISSTLTFTVGTITVIAPMSPTMTPSATMSPTMTVSGTQTATATMTVSTTATGTATSTRTATTTSTSVATVTPTSTSTGTSTSTPTATALNSPVSTGTAATSTATSTSRPTNTATSTTTSVPTNTSTNTPTNTSTNTATNTPVNTSTSTSTSTNTPTSTGTAAATATSFPTIIVGTTTATATITPVPLPLVIRYYFAGGVNAPGQPAFFTVTNPEAAVARVRLTFYFPNGAVSTASFRVGAHTHRTIAVSSLIGRTGRFGLVVASDRNIVAGLVLTRVGRDDDTLVGSSSLARTWYLAEGYTALTFHETVAILNPGPRSVRVSLLLLPAGGRGRRQSVSLTVGGQSERVVDINTLAPNQPLSIVAASNRGVVVERTLTFSSDAAGNGYGMTTRLLLYNPNPRSTRARITVYQSNGSTTSTTIMVAAGARGTFDVGSHFPGATSQRGEVVQTTDGRGIVVEQTVFAPDHSTLRSTQGLPKE